MSEAKKHVYLLQGQAKYVDKFAALRNRKDADLFFLTYDTPKENCIFLPNSNWAEGRNRLLQEALKTKIPYQYFTFLDDDVEFIKGGWDKWEKYLLKLKPAIAYPLFARFIPKHNNIIKKAVHLLPYSYNATPYNYDEQMIAYHKDIVMDEILLPYVLFAENTTTLNANNRIWWNLMFIFYSKWILEFTKIVVSNKLSRYVRLPELEFHQIAKEHLLKNLNPKYHSQISVLEAQKPKKMVTKREIIIEELSIYRKIKRLVYRNFFLPIKDYCIRGYFYLFKRNEQYQPKDNYLTSLKFKREVFQPSSVLYPKNR